MMSVLEYAEDINKTVEEILSKCKELSIDARVEDDMLSDEDIITLDNYFDHLTFIKTSDSIRNYLKDDIIKLAPKNNILFKAVVWELLQNEEMKIGKLSNKFDNARDDKSVAERRYKIRRS